jgi:hypothetical protein
MGKEGVNVDAARKRQAIIDLVEVIRSDKVTLDQAVEMVDAALEAALAGQVRRIIEQCVEILSMSDLKGDRPDQPPSSS